MNPARPIIAAVDFSAASSAVVHQAVHAADLAKTSLLLVHIMDSALLSQHAVASGKVPDVEFLLDHARKRLREMMPASGPSVACEFVARCGRPSDEIHAIVEERDAALLVIAANSLTKHHPGSVASACIRTIPCDILVLREWQGRSYRKIMVCTDLSAAGARALGQGISLAILHGAELEIVYVMYPPSKDAWGELLQTDQDEEGSNYAERCRNGVKRNLDRFILPLAERLKGVEYHTTILESAIPAQALKYHVLDVKAELVVVGSKLHSRFSRLFSVGIADHLLNETTASVFAVREIPGPYSNQNPE